MAKTSNINNILTIFVYFLFPIPGLGLRLHVNTYYYVFPLQVGYVFAILLYCKDRF